MPDKHIFIFGLGYVGRHLGCALSLQGWRVTGTTRNPSKLNGVIPEDWTVLRFEGGSPIRGFSKYLDKCSHIISTISALSGHDPVLCSHHREIKGFSGWTGYVSATSVYPSQKNGFIDENVLPNPTTKRGRDRVDAEKQWQKLSNAEIFRVAGIYGPGRNALDALREGRARIIESPGQISNRIHQTDITNVIAAAIKQPRPKRIINVCDNKPTPQGDVIRFAAKLLNLPPPQPIQLKDAVLTPMARSFYVSNRRIKSVIIGPELGVKLEFPTYREGLKALFKKSD